MISNNDNLHSEDENMENENMENEEIQQVPSPNTKYYSKINSIYLIPLSPAFNTCIEYHKKINRYQDLMYDIKHQYYTNIIQNPYNLINIRRIDYTHFNFLQDELINISNVDNYYVNFISTTMFEIFAEIINILQLNYISQDDQNNLRVFNENLNMMYNFLSEGINVLNIDNIKNLRSFIYLLGISLLDIKYIPLMISICDIEFDDRIMIRYNGNNIIRNLMMLSLINNEVRTSIVDKIGKYAYTEFLLKKQKFSVFENEGLMTYLEFSFLIDSFKNILNCIDYSVILKYKFFNNNNILHLIAILFNDETFRNEIIFNFNNIDLNVFNTMIFDKNEYDLIPLEMINPINFDKVNCDKFHIFYTFKSDMNIKSFNNTNFNVSPKLLFNMYNNLENICDINNNLRDNEIYILNYFNKSLKFYKTEETNTYKKFVKSLYVKNYDYILDSNLNFIELTPYFSSIHMNLYIDYIKNKNKYNLHDLLMCEFYDIYINKDKKYKYLNTILEESNVFYDLIHQKIKSNDFNNTNNIEMIEFIKSKINITNPSTNDIKIMLILKNVEFNIFEIKSEKVNLKEIYNFILTEVKQLLSFNRNVFNMILPYIVNLVKTNYDFYTFLQNSDDNLILFNSNLPLYIKFGTTQNEISNTILNYYKPEFQFKFPKEQTEKYLNEYGNILSKIFLKNSGYEYTILNHIKRIFNIEQEFFDTMNLPKKFKEILSDITDYISNIYWIQSFLDVIKLNREFFDKEFCSNLLRLPYEVQKLFVENKYLNKIYLDDFYIQFLKVLVINITDIETYIKNGLINYKDIFESELIIKFFKGATDCDFIILNDDFKKSFKTGLKMYEIEIKSDIFLHYNHYNNKVLYQVVINDCLPSSLYDDIIKFNVINSALKYIKYNQISLNDIIDKLAVISKYNYKTLRYIITYLFLNCREEELIIKYFNLIHIESIPLNEYINAFGTIENDTVFKAIIKVFEKEGDILANIIIFKKKLFMNNTNIFSMDERIQLLLDNFQYFKHTFIHEFIDSIKTRNTNPLKLFELIEKFKIDFNKTLLNIYPELINCSLVKLEEIDRIVELSITDETIIQNILKFENNTCQVFKKLMSTFIKIDFETYIMIVTSYSKQNKFKIENSINNKDIINECKNNSHLYLNLLKDEFFKNEELDSFIKLKNNTGTFIITHCDEELILKYFDKFTKDEILEKNIFGVHQLFSFCLTENIIIKIFDKFETERVNFKNITDKMGRNIYYYCAKYGLFQYIPIDVINYDFLLKIIINSKSDISLRKFLDKFIKDNIFNEVDNENVSIVIQLAKYRPSIFKAYYGSTYFNKLVEILGHVNMNNETYLMNLIKYSDNADIMFVINKLFQTNSIKLNMSYVDNNSGSILTYLIKYSRDISNIVNNIFIKDSLYDLSYMYDTVPYIINPFSNTNSENNVRLNLLQIAVIYDVEVLRFLMKSLNRKRIKHLMKEKIIFKDKDFNLLSLAICNNPEAVQEILSHVLCDDMYIQDTEKIFSNFEEVSDIQPGSFYYLQSSSKTLNKIKLNMDYHYYGYNYKIKITPNNIKNVTHYILDKQELGSRNNLCEICMSFKQKVVLTKCSHKVCIVCALKTKNCQTCRTQCEEKDKILI